MMRALELEFQTAARCKCRSSSCRVEEDDDVASSTKLAKSTQNPAFPSFFSILTIFQTNSHENVYGSKN